MKIGYARTSTVEQQAGYAAQIAALEAEGCEKVFKEQVSSVAQRRGQLEQALDYCRDGDKLVCTKLDRLARSVGDVVDISKKLAAKGAGLLIIELGIDTSTASGRLTLNLFASIAQFEREVMLERQREGIAKAKAEGKYKGRKPTAMAKAGEVRRLAAEGVGKTEIANRLGIGRASVYRCLGADA